MRTIQINSLDNVAVALSPIAKGETITAGEYTVTARCDIPQGHKIALKKIDKDTNVTKYGFPIGHATEEIEAGDWVHSHNMVTNLEGEVEYTYQPAITPVTPVEPEKFNGFRRKD